MEKKEIKELDYTKEDLLDYIKLEKKIDKAIIKEQLKNHLKSSVNRVLDCNQYLHDIEVQYNKSRKLINKYAKSYKKEKDIKKYCKTSDDKIANAVKIRFWAIFDLMNIVETILCDSYNIDLFRRELPNCEEWFEFEPKDMILVNGFVSNLKQYKRNRIDINNILYELNYAINEYSKCIQENIDYKELYDKDDGFINIVTQNNLESKEQEEKDE